MGLNTETSGNETNVPAANQEVTTTFPRKTRFRFNLDKDTNIQREAVEVNIPVPSVQGVIEIIKAGMTAPDTDDGKKQKKTLDYLLEVVGDAVVKEVRGFVSDNLKASQDTIDWAKFTFSSIACMPAGIRGASSIAKELWDAFAKNYVEVASANGVTAEVAAVRVSVMVQKFRPLTGNPDRKAIIENLMGTLAVFMEKSSKVEEFTPILDFLVKKADELKAEDSIVTANALGFDIS